MLPRFIVKPNDAGVYQIIDTTNNKVFFMDDDGSEALLLAQYLNEKLSGV